MIVYRDMTQAELDAAYNNRAVVSGWEGYLARWARASDELYRTVPVRRDLRYGAGERQRIDWFPAGAGRPTVLFLHGGYWQWNDKEGQAFVAAGLLPHGINVAVGEYTLAPAASMEGIVAEAGAMVDWLGAQPALTGGGPLYVCGISTGAHLMATTLGRQGVSGGLLISGLYDLEPIRLSWLNAAIGMDAACARRYSPIYELPAQAGPVLLACGALELPEMQRQSREYHAAAAARGLDWSLDILAGHDHFSILDQLADPEKPLARAFAALIERAALQRPGAA